MTVRKSQFIGALATAWAIVKFAIGSLLTPFLLPFIAWRAAMNHSLAKSRVGSFRAAVTALDVGVIPPAPTDRVTWLSADTDLFISSDLHRCYPGARDWLEVQGTKPLYAAMLDHYADVGAHVIENGDIEDFWMIGGSPYGQAYDAARVATKPLPGRLGLELRRSLYRQHLHRIVEANRLSYDRIARRLAPEGRYHRTVGNHDDVFLDPALADTLAEVIGGVEPTDWVVLARHDGSAAAVITHGHQTDGWNSPGRSGLGQSATWLANTLSDTPGLQAPDSIPPRALTLALLRGQLPNHLITVDQRFGANIRYDSLDEEGLFDAFGGATEAGPWILLGHTHLPVFQPLSRSAVPWARYVNSGNGLWNGMVTGIEWSGAEQRPRLVAWLWADDADTAEFTDGHTVTHWQGRPIARVELARDPDGRHVRAASSEHASPGTPHPGVRSASA